MKPTRAQRAAVFERAAERAFDRNNAPYACCQVEKDLSVRGRLEFVKIFGIIGDDDVTHISSADFKSADQERTWSVTALCFAAAMARRGDL